MYDRDITDCLMNLPCFPSRKKKEGRPTKYRKCSKTISDEHNKPKLLSHTYDSTVEQCYLNLPKDMVEDNPLDLKNIKERQDHDEKLMQSAVKYPEWYTHNLVHIGKIRYIKNIKNLPPGARYLSACRPALPRCFESPGQLKKT
jgi:hypothetical protein